MKYISTNKYKSILELQESFLKKLIPILRALDHIGIVMRVKCITIVILILRKSKKLLLIM